MTSFLCHILGINFCCTLGPLSRQPPPANPFSKPLKQELPKLLLGNGRRTGNIAVRRGFVLPVLLQKLVGEFFFCSVRGFEKGLADRGGWREEILHMPEIQASFLYPFSYAPLGEGGHISREFWGSFLGFVCRQPPPANPFSKP